MPEAYGFSVNKGIYYLEAYKKEKGNDTVEYGHVVVTDGHCGNFRNENCYNKLTGLKLS